MSQSKTDLLAKKILVSGFKPFAGHTVNPTETLMEGLNKTSIKNVEIKTIVLPVSYAKAFKALEAKVLEFDPDIILATGLAADRSQISLERIAINCESSSLADNDGEIAADRKIEQGAVDGIFTTLPIYEIFNAIQKLKIPIHISNSAGTYVCNSLMYKILKRFSATKTCGFIHIPPEKSLNSEQALRAIKTAIEVMSI